MLVISVSNGGRDLLGKIKKYLSKSFFFLLCESN